MLPPLFKPPVVRLTELPAAGVMVTPLPLVTVLLPAASVVVTLVTFRFGFNANCAPPATVVLVMLLSPFTLIVSPSW